MSFMTTTEWSIIFGGSWGSSENWIHLKTKLSQANLPYPNPWNALYQGSQTHSKSWGACGPRAAYLRPLLYIVIYITLESIDLLKQEYNIENCYKELKKFRVLFSRKKNSI